MSAFILRANSTQSPLEGCVTVTVSRGVCAERALPDVNHI